MINDLPEFSNFSTSSNYLIIIEISSKNINREKIPAITPEY